MNSEDDHDFREDDGLHEYRLPEDEDERGDDDTPSRNVWALFFGIMMNPVEGWKDLRRSGISVDRIGFGLFLPVSAAAALSDFCKLYYDSNISFLEILINAVLTFISFFIGYFIAVVASKILLPKETKNFLFTNFGKAMAMLSISTLALFHIADEILPIFEPIFYFLPLWTVYIIVKGMKFVKIRENRSSYTLGVMCVTIVGAPIFVEWVFSLFSF